VSALRSLLEIVDFKFEIEDLRCCLEQRRINRREIGSINEYLWKACNSARDGTRGREL